MKLGTLKNQAIRDGDLCLISPDLKKAVKCDDICPSLLAAVENWQNVSSSLEARYQQVKEGTARGMFEFNLEQMAACLPRTWLFADGSAFIHHIKLVRMARKAPLPETLETRPLIYQGESGNFLAPTEPIPQRDFSHGTDFEGEVGVITDFVPMGTGPEEALGKIRLAVLINDVSLRGLIPEELAQGFGFFISKPASALSPVAVTLDELGDAWKNGRIHLPLSVKLNGEFFGNANAGAMHFHFGQLISYAAQTRDLQAGTLIGSGTVSNEAKDAGSSCLAEKRMIEQIEKGQIQTPFMKPGDRVEIEMFKNHQSIFGKINQEVRAK